jgi:hypothetical protein
LALGATFTLEEILQWPAGGYRQPGKMERFELVVGWNGIANYSVERPYLEVLFTLVVNR